MRKFFASLALALALVASPAAAQYVTPVNMRDANLTLSNVQNFVTTLNTFTAQRTLTIPGAGGMNAYYLQFIDTANAINGANTLRVVAADGSLINGSSNFTVAAAGVYLFIVPSPTGYSASAIYPAGASTPAGGTSGQIQYNNSGFLGGFTMSGDATTNTSTGVLTLATVNANVGSFGSATTCTAFTTNAKGLITAASAVTCTPAIASITGLGTGVATALGITVGTAGSFVVNGGALGTPSSGTLTNTTGYPVANLAGAGTGVLAALAINVGSAGAPVLLNGAGGTPSSMVGTNITGTAAGLTAGTASAVAVGGITGAGAGCITWLTTPSSANLRGCLTDETGPGLAYFQGGDLGTPSAGVGTNLTALNASNLSSGTVAAARGGAGTITGALKGSGAGVVSQAACADLSNGTALCSTTPGTGVATALSVNVGTAGAFVVNGGALGSPSSAGTMPAFTLGGAVTGGAQSLNNIGFLGINTSSATFNETLHLVGGTTSGTDSVPLFVEAAATNAPVDFVVYNNAAVSTTNQTQMVLQLNDSIGRSTAFTFQAALSTTANATRTATVNMNISENGATVTAANLVGRNWIFGGSAKSSNATGGVGYSTGAGGTVTQATSRTTGVTLNTVSGAITLVSAAGSATANTFTVTNSAVAATDVVIVNQKSGTDKYQVFVTAVAAGSFNITFFTTGGTTTEQPVFNFAVVKAVAN